MLLRMIYDDTLAQAAYLIGCQRTGEAVVIDPERDADRYIDAAAKQGLRITAVAETHIHADFLSGSRELAERIGAKVYVSDEGGPGWTYQWLDKKAGGGSYAHQKLRHGDTFRVGNIELRVVHTPGHTPEHICFLVTDRGGGAAEPMGIATGDFVFVGDLGRPDLLETAAGVAGAKEPSARALHGSVRKFLELPDYVQVWPAHGAGSACGKALGAVPQTTVGYERRFNPAISAAATESRFVDFILSGQPEPPMYFARMKRDNKMGPRILGEVPRPRALSPAELANVETRHAVVVDARPWSAFRAAHAPGAIFAPFDGMFANVVGSYIGEESPIVLLIEPVKLDEAVRALVRIGLDNIVGWADPAALDGTGIEPASTPEIDARAARARLAAGDVIVVDVRRADEYAEGHVPGAVHAPYTRLPERLDDLPAGRPLLVHCRSGARSARACAYLQRRGFDATNLAGGFLAWEKAGGAVERGGEPAACGSEKSACSTR